MINSINSGANAIQRSQKNLFKTASDIAQNKNTVASNAVSLLKEEQFSKAACKVIETSNETFKSLVDIKV